MVFGIHRTAVLNHLKTMTPPGTARTAKLTPAMITPS